MGVYTLFNMLPYDVPISNDTENNASRKAEEEHIMEMQNVKNQVKSVFLASPDRDGGGGPRKRWKGRLQRYCWHNDKGCCMKFSSFV